MRIGAFVKNSLIDYPGQISAVIFSSGCNFRCPYCFNAPLLSADCPSVDIDIIKSELYRRRRFLSAVVLSGGEPLLNLANATYLIGTVKSFNYKVKVDTNGSFPEHAEVLKSDIDYLAMDLKVPVRLYRDNVRPVNTIEDLESRIKDSIKLVKTFSDYEFRTTLVPGVHTPEMLKEILDELLPVKRFTLQMYKPVKSVLNPEDISCYYFTESQLDEFRRIVSQNRCISKPQVNF